MEAGGDVADPQSAPGRRRRHSQRLHPMRIIRGHHAVHPAPIHLLQFTIVAALVSQLLLHLCADRCKSKLMRRRSVGQKFADDAFETTGEALPVALELLWRVVENGQKQRSAELEDPVIGKKSCCGLRCPYGLFGAITFFESFHVIFVERRGGSTAGDASFEYLEGLVEPAQLFRAARGSDAQ